MVAAVRGEKFVEVTEDMQRESEYYNSYGVGEMVAAEDEVDADHPHYYALDEVIEWLGFTEYEDYAHALETEREEIFERAR
jgi:hypothetical protein